MHDADGISSHRRVKNSTLLRSRVEFQIKSFCLFHCLLDRGHVRIKEADVFCVRRRLVDAWCWRWSDKSAYPLIHIATLYPDSVPHLGDAVFLFYPSSLYLQISANFLFFLKSFSDFPVSYRLDNSKTVEIRNIFSLRHPVVRHDLYNI